MARKCDSTKYRKRRRRQKLNAAVRESRLALLEAEHREKWRKLEDERRAAWLADPKRQLGQRLVNILYHRLCSNPFYQVIQASKLFGVDVEAMLDAAARGDDSFPLPPGYLWLKEGSPGSGRYD